MKSPFITTTALTAFLCTGAFAEDKRAADAHQHGHGVLNVALEGETLSVELETPGADILGFEHKADTAEDKATVQAARETLADAALLFSLPDAAKCTVTDAEIEIGADETDHHDDHAEEGHGDDEHSEDKQDDEHAKDDHDHEDDHAEEEDGHTEVHAHYTMTCAEPEEIAGLDLSAFFDAFPNAEELDAAILSDTGQASAELTRASPGVTF